MVNNILQQINRGGENEKHYLTYLYQNSNEGWPFSVAWNEK
jgi:hypothetical protein